MNLTWPVYAIAISGFGSEADLAKSKAAAGFRQHVVTPLERRADLMSLLDEAVRELHL